MHLWRRVLAAWRVSRCYKRAVSACYRRRGWSP